MLVFDNTSGGTNLFLVLNMDKLVHPDLGSAKIGRNSDCHYNPFFNEIQASQRQSATGVRHTLTRPNDNAKMALEVVIVPQNRTRVNAIKWSRPMIGKFLDVVLPDPGCFLLEFILSEFKSHKQLPCQSAGRIPVSGLCSAYSAIVLLSLPLWLLKNYHVLSGRHKYC